jgi:hypothetical protein
MPALLFLRALFLAQRGERIDAGRPECRRRASAAYRLPVARFPDYLSAMNGYV